MRQTTIFDPPRARATDKHTSHAGASTANIGKASQAFMDTLGERQMTALEVATEAFNRCAFGSVESVRKRSNELVSAGLLVECQPRKCSISGKQATTYKRA